MKQVTRANPKQLKTTLSLLLVSTTIAIYAQLATHEFINYDDGIFVFDNPYVYDGLTAAHFSWAFMALHGNASYWHPITWISHQLDCTLFGLHPEAHHLTNLCIHLANSVMLLHVLHCLTGKLWRSTVVAALFALHPMHVETVAWVSERKGLLCAFFWFLTLWAYARYTRRPSFGRYLIVAVSCTASLMSKPFAVTLPFALLVLDFWPLQRLDLSKSESSNVKSCYATSRGFQRVLWLVAEKVPLILLAIASSCLTIIAQRQLGAMASISALPINLRVANALVAYWLYIDKMIWPIGLAPIYPFQSNWPWWQIIGAVLLLCCVSAAVIRCLVSHPYLLAGWLWYLGTLFPVIGLFQTGIQGMADRYSYIPLTGIFIAVTWGVAEATERRSSNYVAASLCTLVAISLLGILSALQIGYWKNSIKLFGHTVLVTRQNFMAYYVLGLAFHVRHNPAQAVLNFRQAIRIDAEEYVIHADLGHVLFESGDGANALLEYNRALELNPHFDRCHAMLAQFYADSSNARFFDLEKATYYADRACKLSHYKKREYLMVLAGIHSMAKRFTEASEAANQALRASVSGREIAECHQLIAKIGEYKSALR